VKFSRFLKAGSSCLCQFLNVQCSAAVFIGGDEMLCGTDKFGFLFHRLGLNLRGDGSWRLLISGQFGTEST
jgi:hypothetical protein